MGKSQKFIKKWERDRQKGKVRYIINNSIIFATVYWILTGLLITIKGNGFNNITKYMVSFIGLFIAYIIGLHIGWKKNEAKYNQLTSNK